MASRWLLSPLLLVAIRFAVLGAIPIPPPPVLLAVSSGWELLGGPAPARHAWRGARHATRDLCRAERHLYRTVHRAALSGDLMG